MHCYGRLEPTWISCSVDARLVWVVRSVKHMLTDHIAKSLGLAIGGTDCDNEYLKPAWDWKRVNDHDALLVIAPRTGALNLRIDEILLYTHCLDGLECADGRWHIPEIA